METCHVLSGLSRKCGLHLLSPASNPVGTTSRTGTFPKGVHTTSNAYVGNTLESVHGKGIHAGSSSCDIQPTAPREESEPSSNIAFMTKEWETTEDRITGNEEPDGVMFHDKPSSTTSAVTMDARFSEGNGVSNSDWKPFTGNEELGGVTGHQKPSTISTVMAVTSSSVGIEDNGGSMFNNTPISQSSAISPVGDALPSQGEVGSRVNAVTSKDGLDEGSNCGPCYEKLSSSTSPSSAFSLLEEDSSLPELRESTAKQADDDTELSELPGHVAFQKKPSSTISPCAAISPVGEETSLPRELGSNVNLVDGEDSLDGELDCFTSQEKPSSAISPVRENAISPQEEVSTVKLVYDEDRLEEEADDVMCHAKPCPAISPFEEVALLSAKDGSTLSTLSDEGELDQEPEHVTYHENPSSTARAVVTNASMSVVKGNAVKLVPVEDKHDGEPDHVTCLKGQSSTLGTVMTDAPLPQEKNNKKKTKKKSKKSNTPFERWLQNFTKFCQDQNEIEEKQMEPNKSTFEDSASQGAPGNCRGKKGCKKRSRKGCKSGNLESYDTSAKNQSAKQTACVPSTNMSEFVCEDATGGHIDTSDHEQNESKSDSVNGAEAIPYTYRNLFEIMEDKEAQSEATNAFVTEESKGMEIDSEDDCAKKRSLSIDNSDEVEEAQSKATNSFVTEESKDMEIDSEDACAKKRSLSIDNSDNVEQTSAKKLKNESDSECKSRTKRPLDTNWNKSDDLPLMANVDEVLVHHYVLDLSVKFSEKILKGNIVLFLEPRNEEVTKRQFQMTLDSTLVNIESVSEVVLPEDFEVSFCGHRQDSLLTQETSSSGVQNGFLGNILGDKTRTPLPFKGLSYSVYGWCVQIWKPDATGKAWPRCVWIKYHTSPEGSSLTWATDQDGK